MDEPEFVHWLVMLGRLAMAGSGHAPDSIQLTSDDHSERAVAVVDLPSVRAADHATIIDTIARLPGVKSVRTM